MLKVRMTETTIERAIKQATLVHHECCILVELYEKKEGNIPTNIASGHLVSVTSLFPQLETRGKLQLLHSVLENCHNRLLIAIAKEEEELDGDKKGEYETQREKLEEVLQRFLQKTKELLKATDGPTITTPSLEVSKLDDSIPLFKLKLKVYEIFKEVKQFSKMAATILQEMQSDSAKEPTKRRKRSARRSDRKRVK